MRSYAVAACLVLATACGGVGEDPRGARTMIDKVVGDDTTLDVTYTVGLPECYDSSRVEVEESTTEVRLTAWIRGNGKSCPAVGVPKTDVVTLKAPVGGRTVVDAYTGEPPPVQPSP